MSSFPPRRAVPGQAFDFTDPATGNQRTLRADGNGVVRPKDDSEHAIAEAFGLTHAQPAAIRRARAASRKKTTRKAAPKLKVVSAKAEISTPAEPAPTEG